jgi:hypothetical protein
MPDLMKSIQDGTRTDAILVERMRSRQEAARPAASMELWQG